MKKNYDTPQLKIVDVECGSMLCASPTPKAMRIKLDDYDTYESNSNNTGSDF